MWHPHRCSGESEEDQRLRLCSLFSERGCHCSYECTEWKGEEICFHGDSIQTAYNVSLCEEMTPWVIMPLLLQVIDNSPIEVTLAKPVDKDSYVRYTRGTGGRGAAMLQSDYAYTLGQMYDPSTAYLGAPVFYAPHAYTALPSQFRFPTAKGHVSTRGLVRPPSVRGKRISPVLTNHKFLTDLVPANYISTKGKSTTPGQIYSILLY